MTADAVIILEAATKVVVALYILATAACAVAVSSLVLAVVAVWIEFREGRQ